MEVNDMGMFSWTDWSSLKVRDGSREQFERWIKENEEFKEYNSVISIDEDGNVEIEINEWKIISYWYDETLDWIDKLNEFIEGDLAIEFENHDEYAIVKFGAEKATIKIGHLEFNDYSTDDLREEGKDWKEAIESRCQS
jgi:hypothetical protein